MSGGAEMIAGAVVQHVAGMLGQAAKERVELLWSFKDDVEEMKEILLDLQDGLGDAENRSRGKEAARERRWLKKLKSVAYNIEDALEELDANAMIWKNSPRCPHTVKLFFSTFNPLIVRITMSNKMRKIRGSLNKITDQHKKFNFVSDSTRQAKDVKSRQTFVGHSDQIEIVGRKDEKKKILDLVLQKDGNQKISIIPIVGLGGMGKTTLAKFVFRAKETNMFDVKAWVHVSMEFELNKIVSAIITEVEGGSQANGINLQSLKSRLDRILGGKCYLIVLDDLWKENPNDLTELMEMLQCGNEGSRVIVTTRNEKVADVLSTIMPSNVRTVAPIKLEGLSVNDCWSIMKRQQVDDLEVIGREIANKCRGVPLVANALGHILFTKKHCTREEWLKIRDSNMLGINDEESGILEGLMLSYNHMPSQLKLCFMYCSIFPRSHDINHDCLIQQWIALGFIQNTEGRSLQTIGEEHIDDFLGMSFLTLSTTPVVTEAGTFKPTQIFRMHDMVHDLARYVAGDEFLHLNVGAKSKKTDNRNCLYQLLMDHNEASSTYKAFPTKVRALHFRGCDKMLLPKQAFSHSICARVLDLSGCSVSELPSSIYKLKLLRYLDASNLCISNLPKSLNHLLNMQTLILSNTSLKTLPLNIGCLQKLQYFDLSRCVNLHELPTSFGNLSDLLFLNLASCHELQSLPESFGNLCTLQFLNLSDCYKLHSIPESCCQLHGLSHFDLSDCHSLGKLPECIGELSKLEYLNMTSCSKVEVLPDSLCKLVMLKHLNLSFCVKLVYLPSRIGDLQLKSLDIQGCVWLRELPDSIFNMRTLENVEATLAFAVKDSVNKLKEHLELEGCSQLDGGSGDLWGQIVDLENTQYYELVINSLESVKQLEDAEQAKLSNNSNLRRLKLTWEHDQDSLEENTGANKDTSMLEKLVPPRSLEHLELDGYMSVDFPSWMFDITSYLPHLTTVVLYKLKWCSCLPPLGRLPSLRALWMEGMPNIRSIGKEFYGDYRTCQKLRSIMLRSMDNLEEWWTTRSSNEEGEFLIPNLHYLETKDCPKLKFMPYPPRSVYWVVWNSDDVLPERGFGSLSSTTSPFYLHVIGSAPLSSKVWCRMQYLSSLECLRLGPISGLRTLPEAIQCFTSLRSLGLRDCLDLETLPDCLGDLSSLREIGIFDCPKLSSLPESMQRLTELKALQIVDCPTLSERCQGEDQHKIAHIPEVTFE